MHCLNLIMPSNHLSIKSWDKSDRPREKFLEQGPRYLSDSELLSIFLGTEAEIHDNSCKKYFSIN